jgi:biotin carboxyl carrier protein
MRGRAIFLLALLALAAVLVTGYLRHRTAERNSEEYTGQVGQATEGHGPGFVALDSATIGRIGLKTTALISGRAVSELTLTGEIVSDPQGTSTLRAPLAGRLSATGRPWPAFGQQVHAGEEVAQVSDAKPLTIPRSGEVIRVSAQPGEQVAAGQEILVIADFEHPLARLAWRDEAPASPPHTIPAGPARSGAPASHRRSDRRRSRCRPCYQAAGLPLPSTLGVAQYPAGNGGCGLRA